MFSGDTMMKLIQTPSIEYGDVRNRVEIGKRGCFLSVLRGRAARESS